MAKPMIEKLAKAMQFLKDAFCIDGSCEWDPNITNLPCKGNCFRLVDSERGVFYVAIVPEKDMKA